MLMLTTSAVLTTDPITRARTKIRRHHFTISILSIYPSIDKKVLSPMPLSTGQSAKLMHLLIDNDNNKLNKIFILPQVSLLKRVTLMEDSLPNSKGAPMSNTHFPALQNLPGAQEVRGSALILFKETHSVMLQWCLQSTFWQMSSPWGYK